MPFIRFLQKKSTPLSIGIGLLFILFVNWVAFPYFSSETVNVHTILDLHFGFSPKEVLKILSLFRDEDRKQYFISTLFVDTPYALVYGFVYAFIVIALLKQQKMNRFLYSTLVILPFFISFFDLVENMGILYFIENIPRLNTNLIKIFSLSNQLKWVFAGITFLVILYLVAHRLIKKLRG